MRRARNFGGSLVSIACSALQNSSGCLATDPLRRLLLPLFALAVMLSLSTATYAQQARDAEADAVALVVSADQMPNGYLLESVYPNPFNPTASVGFAVARTQRVEVGLYDALGRKVRTLFAGAVQANTRFEARVDGSGLPSGLYLIRFSGDGFSTTRRATLVK